MERKDQIALALLLCGAACGGIFLTTLSHRIRDLFFFLMVTLSAVTEYIDVNFASQEWYRGTTCGFEVSTGGCDFAERADQHIDSPAPGRETLVLAGQPSA